MRFGRDLLTHRIEIETRFSTRIKQNPPMDPNPGETEPSNWIIFCRDRGEMK